jgi:cytochrome b
MTARIYDLPTRIFHWLFAGSFLTAFTIANTVDDESKIFAYHMLAGLVMGFIVLWRIVWGLIGSTHARFSDFSLNPKSLLQYGKGVLSGKGRLWVGHNPASSWAAITMLSLALGLGVTGYLMANGSAGESLEDIHELLANAFIVVVILHVAGVILHTLQHKDALGKSMVSGHKSGLQASTPSVSSHPIVAMIALLLTLSFAGYLLQNFDATTGSVKLFGTTLQLTDNEAQNGETEHDED